MAGCAMKHRTARWWVAKSLADAAEAFPSLKPISFDATGLEPREARLGMAIYRTVMQRWITLEYFLDQNLRKPMHRLEPRLRGVLLSGAAQLIFFDRLPAHAVVNESVKLAKSLVRTGAGGLTNSVLRKLSTHVDRAYLDPWQPARDKLPIDEGYLKLCGDFLPPPDRLDEYLSVATSHPRSLVKRWISQCGQDQAAAICLAGTRVPPTIVAMGRYLDPFASPRKRFPIRAACDRRFCRMARFSRCTRSLLMRTLRSAGTRPRLSPAGGGYNQIIARMCGGLLCRARHQNSPTRCATPSNEHHRNRRLTRSNR